MLVTDIFLIIKLDCLYYAYSSIRVIYVTMPAKFIKRLKQARKVKCVYVLHVLTIL